MKSTGSFKRILAVLCTAALLTCSVSALAVSPADVSASASLSAVNSVSEAQLRSALSKLTVTYDSEAEGWQIDSPYEDASIEKASCGLYPYLFVTNDDPTVYLSLGMTYFGNKKLDMKSVRVETEDNYYDFTCDEEFSGGYDSDLKCWFDYEPFDMDDETSWPNEWLAAKSVTAWPNEWLAAKSVTAWLNEWFAAESVTATFTGRDGSAKACIGNKKLDMKSVRVKTKDNYYDFTCDDQFDGGYDNDLKAWFDYELFDMDDETSWLNEWLAAKSVTATFTGRDGSTKTYTLTKDNLQAIRDILNAYDTLLGSDVSTARVVLRGLVK